MPRICAVKIITIFQITGDYTSIEHVPGMSAWNCRVLKLLSSERENNGILPPKNIHRKTGKMSPL
jgi:hypothetical protein